MFALLSLSPLRYVPFIFIARRVRHFLPSSTRVEFCLPTLLSALGNNWGLISSQNCQIH
eukprot:TRINITY_DN2428_c0_g1_i1.p2 TRINITY_DN2428_c0_g1~~TRINITY_DN2428_c0_g1_i1.p2  ORF type:complete len:59 (+),score=13.37 TRINITY_DN2428_c0_g1_i1:130-306(+)